LKATAILISLALVVCGCSSSSGGNEKGSNGATSRAPLTTAESALVSTVSGLVITYCYQFRKNHPFDASANAGMQNTLLVGLPGLIGVAKEKPDATYNDLYGLGKMTMKQWLHVESQKLRSCGSVGRTWAVKLGRTANALGGGP
jgi:hypothetical protein